MATSNGLYRAGCRGCLYCHVSTDVKEIARLMLEHSENFGHGFQGGADEEVMVAADAMNGQERMRRARDWWASVRAEQAKHDTSGRR